MKSLITIWILTVILGFPGCIFSSAKAHTLLVNFIDWYTISCPSNVLFATVNALFCCILVDTPSINVYDRINWFYWATKSIRFLVTPDQLITNIPALHSQFSIVYCTSFCAGMSFHVARKTFFSIVPSSAKNTCIGTMQAK